MLRRRRGSWPGLSCAIVVAPRVDYVAFVALERAADKVLAGSGLPYVLHVPYKLSTRVVMLLLTKQPRSHDPLSLALSRPSRLFRKRLNCTRAVLLHRLPLVLS